MVEEVKQIEIKNRTYYFYNDIINLENFDSNLLKIDKKHYKGINIYYIGYITIKKIDHYESIYSVNPLYLHNNHAKKYAEIWGEMKYKIKTINGGKENNYRKDDMKTKFDSDDDLPLNKPLKFHAITIIIRSVFEEDGKSYPQVFLDDTLYELRV